MSKRFFPAAFAAGLAIVAWVAAGFIGSSWLALAVTGVIGAVYLAGAFELRQFRADTAALVRALDDLAQAPEALRDWLEGVPPALRNAVRTRIEGERVALPGPALTPYLAGLLVMLGMLGTFLGMVVTFKGAVFALQSSTDLQAMRSALAAPIQGLGLSFGTSVAGVAASAMLGLMSTIARRERLEAGRRLDGRIAGVLLPFSLAHQRQETLRAVQEQSRALPQVVDALQALVERIERRSVALDEQLLQRQAGFQREVTLAYSALADQVGTTLAQNLARSATAATDTIRPVVEQAMRQVVQEAQRLHERLGAVAQAQTDAIADRFSATAESVARSWHAALENHERTSEAVAASLQQSLGASAHELEQRTGALLARWDETLARTQAAQAGADRERLQAWTQALQATSTGLHEQWRRVGDESVARQETVAAALEQASRQLTEGASALAGVWRTELAVLRQQESERGEAAVRRLGDLEAAVAQHLAQLGASLEEPLTRLLRTASEVPQAAAAVITQLREEMGRVSERDNLALRERTTLLERLGALLDALERAAGEQRGAIDSMVASAAAVLERGERQFAQAIDAHAGRATESTAQLAAGAVEMGSLAEAFAHSVQQFQASSDRLADSLQAVEASLNRSTARSDEQLAYYVAQAREVIDLSIASQQGLVENLRQLKDRQDPTLALAAGARA